MGNFLFENTLPGALSIAAGAGMAAAVLWKNRGSDVLSLAGRRAVFIGLSLLAAASLAVLVDADLSRSLFREAGLTGGLVLLAVGINKWMKDAGGHALRRGTGFREGSPMVDEELLRFKLMVEGAGEEIYLAQPNGDLLYVNEAAAKSLGYTVKEMLSIGVAGFDPLFGPNFEQHFAELKQRELPSFETHHIAKDGRTVIKDLKSVYLNINGSEYVCGYARDITERKKMERVLSQAKQDWENTFDTITDMITIHDREFNIIRANRAAAEILHLPWIELKRAKCYEYFHGTACPPDECPSCESLQSGRPSVAERFEPHLGKYLEVRAIPRVDASGGVHGLIHVVRDVSERRKTEDMIRAIAEKVSVKTGTEYFREISFFLAHELGMEYAFVGEIIEGGRRAETLAFYAQGVYLDTFKYDLEGTPCARVTHDGIVFHRSGVRGMFPQNERLATMQVESYGGIPLFSSGGGMIGVLVVMGTGMMGLESEKKARLLLQILAARAAMEIERMQLETQLREAQRMEVIGSIAGGVAHEVRNPLNAIMALTDALAQDLESNAEYRLYVEHMRSQVDRLSSLMNDLLELGKPVDTATLEVQSVVDICRASVDAWSLSPVSAGRPVNISVDEHGGRLEVRGDSKKLQQVFINLLDNASQHSRKGGPIRIVVGPAGRDRVRIDVSDEGAGISGEILPRVFDAFFTTRRGGTGLGLSIVRHIIEKHRGSVALRNNDPLPGCTAEILLPREERPRE